MSLTSMVIFLQIKLETVSVEFYQKMMILNWTLNK